MTETPKWEDYERLAAKLAWEKVNGNPYLEFDELMGQAHLAFCIARDKWNPPRGKFSTIFTWWCRDQMGKAGRMLNHLPLDEALNEHDGTSPQASLEFQERLRSLGKEARAVVNMVLNSPHELANFTFRTSVKPSITTVRAYFRACGWTTYKVEKAFKEIRTMLSL